ncbi:hypothetical protein F2Q69_00033952 [Brassica cretica]|uniref:Uncharacterized protein n=1 Tax=Brassica cretica TaxID=69181 RepID=A0A8S9SBD2_BRACR|nr:hypothetical protein F2Q69_00033952 [Brassica cretica]
MSFTSFSSDSAPANLNSSSKGYQFVSTAPVVHQNKHEMEAVQLMSWTQKRITEDPINEWSDAVFFFDNPSRDRNFVSITWPPTAATTMDE